MTHSYVFFLGSTPELSLAELRSVLPSSSPNQLSERLVKIEIQDSVSIDQLMNRLGGTVKIGRIEQTLPLENSLQEPTLIKSLTRYFQSLAQLSITFGLAEFNLNTQLNLTHLKQELSQLGIRTRFLRSDRFGLGAAILNHHSQILDLVLIAEAHQLHLVRTIACQELAQWTNRDRGRPYVDRRRGMLPLKVARMMVNMAISDNLPNELTVYDPFCGTGSIIMEAASMGAVGFGSDQSQRAIAGSSANFNWLNSHNPLKHQPQLWSAEVTDQSLIRRLPPIDAIVTEPFLGKPFPLAQQLPDIFKGLSKLYLGAFKFWRRILKAAAKVVIIFPLVETDTRKYDLSALIDKLRQLGYTTHSGPYLYARPQAVVKRQIWVFTYQPQ